MPRQKSEIMSHLKRLTMVSMDIKVLSGDSFLDKLAEKLYLNRFWEGWLNFCHCAPPPPLLNGCFFFFCFTGGQSRGVSFIWASPMKEASMYTQSSDPLYGKTINSAYLTARSWLTSIVQGDLHDKSKKSTTMTFIDKRSSDNCLEQLPLLLLCMPITLLAENKKPVYNYIYLSKRRMTQSITITRQK